MIKIIQKIILYLVICSSIFGLGIEKVNALSITFDLGFGGIVDYAGGYTPFTTTDGVVLQVRNETGTAIPISGGDLDFETGVWVWASPISSNSFIDIFVEGGSLTIHGDIGTGSTTLLEGGFVGDSMFFCCGGNAGSFGGLLDVTSIHPALASALGFVPPSDGGSIAQTQIILNTGTIGGGDAFSGIQAGGSITVTSSASAPAPTPVPEPTTLILMGIGLLGMGSRVIRRRH